MPCRPRLEDGSASVQTQPPRRPRTWRPPPLPRCRGRQRMPGRRRRPRRWSRRRSGRSMTVWAPLTSQRSKRGATAEFQDPTLRDRDAVPSDPRPKGHRRFRRHRWPTPALRAHLRRPRAPLGPHRRQPPRSPPSATASRPRLGKRLLPPCSHQGSCRCLHALRQISAIKARRIAGRLRTLAAQETWSRRTPASATHPWLP